MSRFVRYAWFVVGYNLLVVLWGAFVRATGSGAGCGSHWPLCNGEVLPRSPSTETLIELSHRITSGLDGFLVLGLLVAAFRRFPERHRVRWAAGASMVFLVAEALVGAGLVRFELVVDDDSMARAVVMAFHLVNTFFLLASLALTALYAGGLPAPDLRRRRGASGPTPWLLAVGTLALLLVGMSGAVTALGDTLFPDRSFTWDDLAPASHFLLRLRILHPALSVMAAVYLLVAALTLRQRQVSRAVDRSAGLVVALLLAQTAAGFVNVQLAAPVWLQLVHLALADLLWIAWVALTAGALAAGDQAAAPAAAAAPQPAR